MFMNFKELRAIASTQPSSRLAALYWAKMGRQPIDFPRMRGFINDANQPLALN
jgi:hypothetical protein